MKININDISGKIVKDNETYTLKDNTTLNNLVLSSTSLKPNQQTRGHSHEGKEEIYFFVSGRGEMVLNSKRFMVSEGDVVLIPDGAFHKVKNDSQDNLYFVCVFEGKREH